MRASVVNAKWNASIYVISGYIYWSNVTEININAYFAKYIRSKSISFHLDANDKAIDLSVIHSADIYS